jgi:signal transduction histidine kinase/CheY-like chemotaxis protein
MLQEKGPTNTILLAASVRDPGVNSELLAGAGLQCRTFPSLTSLCETKWEDSGVVLIAEETLTPAQVPQLVAWLEAQPRWSDIPVIVLTADKETKRTSLWSSGLLGPRANVTLLERPFRNSTLFSVLDGALRARKRQFETRDLLEQREQLLELEKLARAEAEDSNKAKDEFLAMLSHELRTPLTTMLGWSKILKRHHLDPKTTSRALDAIERSAKSQAQLIDDLLDVSRIVTGKFQIEKKNMDLVSLIRSSVEMIRPAAESKQVALSLEIADEPNMIFGDFQRLQQAMLNILSNAVKFTSATGSIHIKLALANSTACISIADTGKGIPQEFLPHIFERFRQGDSTSTRNQGGLGLGLAIVQHIVTLHEGTVKAESDGEGKGSRFTVTLPVAMDESNVFDHSKKENDADFKLEGMKILVVEDDLESRDLIGIILQQGNVSVQLSASVAQALEILKDWKPDVIISDIGMPAEDGYQLLSSLRSNPETKDIPVIALTAYASSFDKNKALQAGFRIHISKPLDPRDLLSAIAQVAPASNGPTHSAD